MNKTTDKDYPSKVAEVAAELLRANSVWVLTHEEPDGDAYGSTLGLLHALRSLDKHARAFSRDPLQRMYSKLPGVSELEHPDTLPDELPDTIAILDNGDFGRLGEQYASKLIALGVKPGGGGACRIVNIDHHISNTFYGDVNLVCPDCAAAGVLVHDIVKALGCKYSKEIAVNLYVALITDTGRFSFSNTNRRALEVAGELVELGANPSKVIEDVYYTRTVNQMQLFGRILSTLTAVPELGALYAWQTQQMLKETGTSQSDTEGMVDLIRTIGEYPLSIFFKENGTGIKVSMRSKNGFDLASFAVSFGGGGHPAAAGFKVEGNLEDAIGQVLQRLGERLA
ncbi:MAG: hypothetical protein HRF49_09865 [bacterium]|jgi:phosphoesterase RecJ-like protein